MQHGAAAIKAGQKSHHPQLELSIEILLLVFGLGNGVVDGSGDVGLGYSAKLSYTKNRLVRPFAGGPR